ncbi:MULTISPECIES: threonine synthase [unclassified Luteococcus]|uniref:threonine synthase n=1 Tax=unclassified Luteococcus TaxID=2639923 RepID=UPI00313DD007
MRYISTRSLPGDPGAPFCDIVLEGLAPDGGLYLPVEYPQIGGRLAELRRVWDDEGYAGLGTIILGEFIDDIPAEDLRGICQRAWNEDVFGTPEVAPVQELGDGLWLCHLSNGPTAAFKDMAMQLLGQLFEYELARRGRQMNILGATSGDTGSAAEYAMRGREHVRVFMLTPAGRMTPFQQAQMFSINDPRIVNIAVEGLFDDCQDLVKAVSNDLAFKAEHSIGAVNSINWARLVAQVVYYVAAWLQVTTEDDQRVSFCVPSGNFGNICAGHVARQMGLPIDTLLLATNENNVLDEFFRTGVYRVRSSAETLETSSPSMDISKASNFERFVFDLLGRDGQRVAELFGQQLTSQGYFDLSGTEEFQSLRERYGFASGSSTHADRVATIRQVWADHGVMIDPHTADGVKVAQGTGSGSEAPMIVLETALPVKFAETIREALGREPEVPAAFAHLDELPRHVVDLPKDVDALKELIAQRVATS